MDARSDKRDPRTDAELVAAALVGDEDDPGAWAAIQELRPRGTREVLELGRHLLQSPSPKARGRGADILAQLGVPERTFPSECVDALLDALPRESTPAVLHSLGVALGHLQDRRAIPTLAPLKDHPDPDVTHSDTGLDEEVVRTALREELAFNPLALGPPPMPERARRLDWAALLERVFTERIFDCACGGRRQVVAFVTDTAKAAEILGELGLPSQPPRLARARGPPRQEELFERPAGEFSDPVYPDS